MVVSLVDRIKNKLSFSKNKGKTLTGEPADEIVIFNNTMKEEKEKRVVFTFGRFNPPTTGHEKLINKVKEVASNQGADHKIFASQSQDQNKNPLPYNEKVNFMKKMYPDTNIHTGNEIKNVFDVAHHLHAKKVTHATLVVGSDRVNEFHNALSKYNKNPEDSDFDPKKHFYIPHLSVISAGHRDPDAQDVTGMSASKLRDHAASGNFNEFKKGVSKPEHAKELYDTLRHHMGINEDYEGLNTTGVRTSAELNSMKTDKLHNKIQNQLNQKKQKEIKKSEQEDKKGIAIANKYKTRDIKLPSDMTQHPYEDYNYNIRMNRDELAPGKKQADLGTDDNLKLLDKNNQMKRRQAMKRFRAFTLEGIDGDIAFSDKPSAFGQLQTPATTAPVPTARKKDKKSVNELFGDPVPEEGNGSPNYPSGEVKITELSTKSEKKDKNVKLRR